MKAASSLANACLSRSTKLSSIRPLRFSSERGSYFDYAEAANLGMYIHVPFARALPGCRTRADAACGRTRQEPNGRELLDTMLEAIEAAGCASWKTSYGASGGRFRKTEPGSRKTVTTLFFKGDTAALKEQEIGALMQAVRARFVVTNGTGFELASSEVTVERLRMLKELGIDHLAVNLTAAEHRANEHPGAPSTRCGEIFAALKEVAFETVSLSLAFAQPGQDAQQFQCTIETALASGANHIAIRPFHSIEAKRLRSRGEASPKSIVEFGCAATMLMAGRFKVNAYSITEYGRRLGAGAAPAALTLKLVERERMVRYLIWAAHAETRTMLAQVRLLRGIGRPHARTAPFPHAAARHRRARHRTAAYEDRTAR